MDAGPPDQQGLEDEDEDGIAAGTSAKKRTWIAAARGA
jgi:hypothetical protein